MNITEIAFSSYAVTDIARSRKFYEEVLGLKADSVWEGDGMAFIQYKIGPHYLSIGAGAPNLKPGPNGGVVVFEVADFDKAVETIRAAKIAFVMEPQDTGACHMALVDDPDGNRLMIHKRKAD